VQKADGGIRNNTDTKQLLTYGLVEQIVNVLKIPDILHGTLLTLAKLTQKIKRVNPFGVAITPLELDGITPHHFGLTDINIIANILMRLQNAQRIRRFGGGAARFRARGARTFAPQKFQRVAARVAIVPLDLQRARSRFFNIKRNHNKITGFLYETVYIITNFALRIKHFY
jgi:hypothetical protein